MNWRFYFCIFISCCCNFLFGYHLVALNNESFISSFTNVIALIVATTMFSVGGLVGAMVAGIKARRKVFFLFVSLFCGIGSICQISNILVLICIGRFFVGVGCGIGLSISPNYISEITPARYRGIATNATNFVTVVAICVSSVFGYVVDWVVTAGIPIIFSAIIFFGLFFIVESPKFLYYESSRALAIQTLSKIRCRTWNLNSEILSWEVASESTEEAMNTLDSSIDLKGNPSRNSTRSFRDMVNTYMHRRHLLLLCILHALQHLSGMNVVYYYSTFILRQVFPTQANLYSILLTVFNVFSSLPLFFIIEKIKRKTLLQINFLGAGLSQGLLCFSLINGQPYLALLSMLLILFFFNLGIGLLPFLLIPELFDLPTRGYASFLAVSVNWIFNIIVASTFVFFLMFLKEYVFLIFMVFMFIGVYISKFLPETRNLSPEQFRISLGY